MAEVSKLTRATQKAHVNILRGFDKARRDLADIPLGRERVDPRTAKKRREEANPPGLDPTLHRLLYTMRGEQAAQASDDDTY